jgi:hypothetical protein
MSRQGMKAALEYGQQLPAFPDRKSAEIKLFQLRDKLIRQITDAAAGTDLFLADYSPESLKALEKWYFELYDTKSFKKIGLDRKIFEQSMSMYYGEVIVRNNPDFRWYIEEYAFIPGRYEMGVRSKIISLSMGRAADLYARTGNQRKQSLWREYRRWTKK